jgi:taurine dioxygenase
MAMAGGTPVGSYRHIEVGPLSGALGAVVEGVDLAGPLAPEAAAELRRALLDHLVIFCHGQSLAPARLLALAGAFGTPSAYPFVDGLPGHPLVVPVIKREDERVNFGGIWHSDTSYLAEPPMATLLYAVEVPPVGGDTLFANMYLAYETLSAGMKALLDGLVAVNVSGKPATAKTRVDMIQAAPTDAAGTPLAAEHPAVRRHPETGRKALYVNVAHTLRFKDMSEAESAPILEQLFAHQVRPEFTCRFRWRPGSLAFWDNRCTQHNPVNDYHGQRRVMHRVTLAGDRPA